MSAELDPGNGMVNKTDLAPASWKDRLVQVQSQSIQAWQGAVATSYTRGEDAQGWTVSP